MLLVYLREQTGLLQVASLNSRLPALLTISAGDVGRSRRLNCKRQRKSTSGLGTVRTNCLARLYLTGALLFRQNLLIFLMIIKRGDTKAAEIPTSDASRTF